MYLDRLLFLPKEEEKGLFSCGYQKVNLEDKPVFDPFYDRMNEDWSSPMSYMAMIAWEKALTFYYKIVGDYLAFLGWDATNGQMTMLPFVGRYEYATVAEAFALVKKDYARLGYPICITDMREWMQPYYEAIPGTAWKKLESDALYDYVYEGSCFDGFSGKSGQNLRYFLKHYDHRVRELIPADLNELTAFIRENWSAKTDCETCNHGCPIDCTERVVPFLPKLGGFGILVEIEGRTVGYCIGSRHGKVSILHFQNTIGGYKGLGVFMYAECRKRFLSGIERISLGEDMGVPGIRTYKQRLAPHEWIPRFELDLISK